MSANDTFLLKIKKNKSFLKKSGEKWGIVEEKYYLCGKFVFKRSTHAIRRYHRGKDRRERTGIPARHILQGTTLVLYPESVWNERVDTLSRRLSIWNRAHQRIMRQFMSDVEEVSLDANGRFLIPKRYLEMAGITTDIKFIGTGATIEIWSGENTQEPFLSPDEFGQALEDVMGQDNPQSANTLENIIR